MNSQNRLENYFRKMLSLANIRINSNRKGDMVVHNPLVYQRILSKGSLGLGESYMDGWWDSNALDVFFTKLLDAKLNKKVKRRDLIFSSIKARVMNLQKKSRAFEVGKKHYDVGNDLYKNMLDKRMVYTCGYWKNAKNLDNAQKAKLDLVCRKLGLKKGQKILDIGCGWGSFAKFAAEKYKVKVVGITVSKEQADLAKKMCKGLPVEIRLQDYRDLTKKNEKFDHVVSLGMFEHVGIKNYAAYMKIVEKVLKKEGLFLLHTIGANNSSNSNTPWIEKYIFPNSMLPSIKQIASSSEGIFVLEDLHNFGKDYDKTLMAWYKNFTNNWDKIKMNYDKRFFRMWTYYLLMVAGVFRSGNAQLWQIVFSRGNQKETYLGIR